jgi:hypothetical protein
LLVLNWQTFSAKYKPIKQLGGKNEKILLL